MSLDASHEPERLLSYSHHTVLTCHRQSELGAVIERLTQPGAVFVDVGANLGLVVLVAKEHGFETVVVAPEPRHAAFLQRNAAVFGGGLAVALSDEPGTLPLYYEDRNSGSTSLFSAASDEKGHEVPVRTFSELAEAGEFGASVLVV